MTKVTNDNPMSVLGDGGLTEQDELELLDELIAEARQTHRLDRSMNLNSEPSIEQLQQLLAACEDQRGHHVVWVNHDGNVHITCLDADVSPVQFQLSQRSMAMRLETLQCGNGYTGPIASADHEWVEELFTSLVHNWPKAGGTASVLYVG